MKAVPREGAHVKGVLCDNGVKNTCSLSVHLLQCKETNVTDG